MSVPEPLNPVLLIDDEEDILRSLRVTLALAGITNTIPCHDGAAALGIASGQEVEAVLLDVLMPGSKGEEVLEELLRLQPDLPVIMVTGLDDLELAVSCMRKGAYDYIRKPADAERIVSTLSRALELRQTRRERKQLSDAFLRPAPPRGEAFRDIITHNQEMLRIFQYCEAIALSPEPVLIAGETGVGKELLARAIHRASGRKGEFVAVNAAGLDEQAFSDTLFGHVRGAFTGADRPRAGLMEQAAGGTLFLDEIGDLGQHSQIKLLRVLQEREYHPLGADRPRTMSAHILAATNRPLEELKQGGRFRRDFFYRITTHAMTIPPLRSRPEDILPLAEHFAREAGQALRKPVELPAALLSDLQRHGFPGNVRELRSLVFDAVGRARDGRVPPDALDGKIVPVRLGRPGDFGRALPACVQLPTLHEASEALVAEALKRSGGNQRQAAAMLGITPQALSARIKRRSTPGRDGFRPQGR